MALPALSKTWQFNTNILSAGNATLETQIDNMLLTVKDLLKGTLAGFTNSDGDGITPTGGWVVQSSCNGAGGGGSFGNGDLVDRWSGIGDIVHASGASNHSWIVLRQTGISSLFEMLIDCNNVSVNSITVTVSQTGFGAANGGSDGTATAAPTASSSIAINTGSSWGCCGTSNTGTRIHFLNSADGAITHVIFMRSAIVAGWWAFIKPEQAQSWWTVPWIAGITGTGVVLPGSNVPSHSSWASSAITDFLKTRHGANNIDIKLGCVGFSQSPGTDFTVANPSGLNPIFGLRALSVTASFAGDHAFVPDLWYGRSGLANGSGYPDPGPSEFVQLGNVIIPWNKSTIQISV